MEDPKITYNPTDDGNGDDVTEPQMTTYHVSNTCVDFENEVVWGRLIKSPHSPCSFDYHTNISILTRLHHCCRPCLHYEFTVNYSLPSTSYR